MKILLMCSSWRSQTTKTASTYLKNNSTGLSWVKRLMAKTSAMRTMVQHLVMWRISLPPCAVRKFMLVQIAVVVLTRVGLVGMSPGGQV